MYSNYLNFRKAKVFRWGEGNAGLQWKDRGSGVGSCPIFINLDTYLYVFVCGCLF